MRRQMRTFAVSFWDDDKVRPVIKWVPTFYYADDVNDVFNQFVATHRDKRYSFSVHEVTAGDIRRINRISRDLLKRNKNDERVQYVIRHVGGDEQDEPIYQNPLFAAMDSVCNYAESIVIQRWVSVLACWAPYDVVFTELA